MTQTQEITVHLRVTDTHEGQPYLVKTTEDGATAVLAIISRKPVNARGFYQCEKVYRTIKPGSANYRAAIKAAGFAA